MQLPDDFAYKADLDMFVSAMGYKLHANRHKGRWEDITLGKAVSLLEGEMKELKEAIKRDSPIEILMEAADIANFALIIASIRLRELGVALAPARPATASSDSPGGSFDAMVHRVAKDPFLVMETGPVIDSEDRLVPRTLEEVPPPNVMRPQDFISHGVWMDGNRQISRMWKGPGGRMYYEDVEDVRQHGLPVYPFATQHTASPDAGTEGK